MEFSAQQIAALLDGELYGNASSMVCDVAPIESAEPRHLSFVTEEKYIPFLANTKAGVVLISKSLISDPNSLPCGEGRGGVSGAFIIVPNARAAMAQLLSLVSKAMNPPRTGIEQPSFVAEGVQISEDAYIGAFAYIGKNVRLGKGGHAAELGISAFFRSTQSKDDRNTGCPADNSHPFFDFLQRIFLVSESRTDIPCVQPVQPPLDKIASALCSKDRLLLQIV